MSLRVVRLGSPRLAGEGIRIGTVRRPPRGVAKAAYAAQDWFDVWFPTLAPSAQTLQLGRQARTAADWAAFLSTYRAEMAMPDARHAIELLARLSHGADFSVGCYCAAEDRCHRSVLRALLADRGARFA